MKDERSEEQDRRIANHVLNIHRHAGAQTGPDPAEQQVSVLLQNNFSLASKITATVDLPLLKTSCGRQPRGESSTCPSGLEGALRNKCLILAPPHLAAGRQGPADAQPRAASFSITAHG